MVTVPRPITGSIGSRVRLVFGKNGAEWLLLLNYDNGDTQWQAKNWSSIPHTVAKQINNCSAKGRIVKAVDFGPDGAWYVRGEKPDGTGRHAWWGQTSASTTIKEWTGSPHPVHASFATTDVGTETYVVIQGTNGYSVSNNLEGGLSDRLKRIHSRSKTIHFVRLFSGGKYFISDQEGMEWQLCNEHITTELQKNNGNVEEIAVAEDGSWVIIRGNNYVSSTGVDQTLKNELSKFYAEQRRYGDDRRAEIREAHAANERERLAREREAQEAREAAERAERERVEREAAEREERERIQREAAEREERERIRREAERAEREAKEAVAAAQLNAATRISSLEATLEKRLIDEACDIKVIEEMLRNRKRSFHEAMQSMPLATRSRITLDDDANPSSNNSNSSNTCVICQVESSVMAVIPCGHVCMCSSCSDVYTNGRNGQRTCPLCRGNMQSVLRIYLGN